MIGMTLEPAVKQELTWEGDMVRSLFKKTEKLLRESEFQKSLQFVAPKKKMEPYIDAIDFLFCELVLGFRRDCFRFYRGEGPPLRNIPRATAERIAEWDIFLATSLHVAHAAMDQDRQLSWRQFRQATTEAIRKAG